MNPSVSCAAMAQSRLTRKAGTQRSDPNPRVDPGNAGGVAIGEDYANDTGGAGYAAGAEQIAPGGPAQRPPAPAKTNAEDTPRTASRWALAASAPINASPPTWGVG